MLKFLKPDNNFETSIPSLDGSVEKPKSDIVRFDIAVGSTNPVKKNAAFMGFEAVWPGAVYAVYPIKFDSIVSVQPMTDEETIAGARFRATAALELCPSARFGVGLEGGARKIGEQYFETGWVVVQDREGNEGIGSSIQMRVPPKVMALIESGQCKEIGDAIDIIFSGNNLKQQQGLFGEMTNGVVTRTTAYRDAVVAALSRFVHPELF